MGPYDHFIGTSPGPRRWEYTWKDVILYALSVGAKADELYYIYEGYSDGGLKGIPTFGSIPVWTQYGEPMRSGPFPAMMPVCNEIMRLHPTPDGFPAGLDWSNDLIIYRPFDVNKGTFLFEDVVSNIYDRGGAPGLKGGVVVESELTVHDEALNVICKNIHRGAFFHTGGYGGPPLPPAEGSIPERDPDYVAYDAMSPTQNALYRVVCGTVRAEDHVDPAIARAEGMAAPTMPGFCAIGYGCRMGIEAAIPGQPERVTRVKADIRGVSFAGDELRLEAWKTESGLVFRLLNNKTNAKILDRGILEFK